LALRNDDQFALGTVCFHVGVGLCDLVERENLQDHPVLPLVFRTGTTDTLKRAESPSQPLSYLLFGRGMLASNGVEGFAFTQVLPGPAAAPDLELMFLPFEFRREFLEPPREHAFILAYAATTLQTVYHPTSTCRMGSDPRSVVDPALRVRGIEGLWIADASVMPAVPRGHPNAVVAMIAHRAAGWIEKDVQAAR
jgi:choline dehydrogenase-like flavoprotein